ncbi:MAG: Cobalt-containing nitrile hydratase subunit alpha, partial [Alphaproteobacteria bacterium MarineAlpha10_Bin3]
MTSFDSDKIAEIHRHLDSDLPTEPALRVKALESVLVEKALLKTEDIDNSVEAYSEKIGPKNGAKIVARAWVDPDYKTRLLADGGAAIAELGFHARA